MRCFLCNGRLHRYMMHAGILYARCETCKIGQGVNAGQNT